jgi:hypothetical protein
MKTSTILAKIENSDVVDIADIEMKLIFREMVVAKVNVKKVEDVVKSLRTWSKLYALKRWASKCNINITFFLSDIQTEDSNAA